MLFLFTNMIQLTKGTTNTLTLTLSEKCTLPVPYFLFYFKSHVTNQELAIVLTDISLFTERFNRFELNDPNDFDFIEGTWEYIVYEHDNDTNTDPALATGEVERGLMKVIDTATPAAGTTYTAPDNNTNTVYE